MCTYLALGETKGDAGQGVVLEDRLQVDGRLGGMVERILVCKIDFFYYYVPFTQAYEGCSPTGFLYSTGRHLSCGALGLGLGLAGGRLKRPLVPM